jgi:hypothetical protein
LVLGALVSNLDLGFKIHYRRIAIDNNKAAENLVGVIKSIVRMELGDRERAEAAREAEASIKQSMRGQRWSEEEEGRLVKEFQLAVMIISVMHRRTEGSIFARLMELRDRDSLQYRVL